MRDKGFSERIGQAMEKSGFTQETLAKAAGVSQSTVSRWLKGSRPSLAVGIHLSTVLNVDHKWLTEGVTPAPEIQFDAGMLRRLKYCRLVEGMSVADIARMTALPEQTFLAVEEGKHSPNRALLMKWISVINAEERFILEGRGRMFRAESQFVLIPPNEMAKRKEELSKLKDEAAFLNARIDRLEWELSQSGKAHKAGPYHPSIVRSVRTRKAGRSNWWESQAAE